MNDVVLLWMVWCGVGRDRAGGAGGLSVQTGAWVLYDLLNCMVGRSPRPPAHPPYVNKNTSTNQITGRHPHRRLPHARGALRADRARHQAPRGDGGLAAPITTTGGAGILPYDLSLKTRERGQKSSCRSTPYRIGTTPHPLPQNQQPKQPTITTVSASVRWKDVEACLWGLRSVAGLIPEGESSVVPQVMQARLYLHVYIYFIYIYI